MSLIAVDFDGVIIKREGIPREKWFYPDSPQKDAQEAIRWLLNEGHEVYILTARKADDYDEMRKWLNKWEFPYMDITNKKREGTALYIDDRAIRFTNWTDVCKYLG